MKTNKPKRITSRQRGKLRYAESPPQRTRRTLINEVKVTLAGREIAKPLSVVGREGEMFADIEIPKRTVSKDHATVVFRNGVFHVIDNNSTNGTYFFDAEGRKTKLTPGESYPLEPMEKIRFANYLTDISISVKKGAGR
jgi:pSer/pThr/pTyr-binding forkhead associated (FHA) protein